MEDLQAISEAVTTGGWIAGSGALIMALVKLWSGGLMQAALRRIPGVPGWLFWDNLTPFGKIGVVFGATSIGTALVAYAADIGIVAAVTAGLSVAVGAIGANKTGEAVMGKVTGKYKAATGGLTAKDIDGRLQAPVIVSDDDDTKP